MQEMSACFLHICGAEIRARLVRRLPEDVPLGDFELVNLTEVGSAMSEHAHKHVAARPESFLFQLREALMPQVEREE